MAWCQTFSLDENRDIIAPSARMELTKRKAPGPTDLIDWLNAEGLLELDWDFPPDGDLFAAGLDSSSVLQLVAQAIEDHYGLILGPNDQPRVHFATPKSFAAWIAAKI